MFVFLFAVIVSVLIYFKLIKPCYYWREKGVKHAKCWPVVGSLSKVAFKKQAFVDVAVDLYNKYPEERYVGYMQFAQRCLLIRDVELIKQIGVKDFNYFTDHAFFGQGSETELVSNSLANLSGEKWKDMRAALTPIFTSGKIRSMYPLIEDCAKKFIENFNEEMELDITDMFSKFACNIIASTAFGTEIDCLKDSNSEFYKMGLMISNYTSCKTSKTIFCPLYPKLAQCLKIKVFPKQTVTFFTSVVKENIQKRETEGTVRPDLIHLLMEARKGKLRHEHVGEEKKEGFATAEDPEPDPTAKEIELTDDHIVAQSILFFFAAFDTVSTTSSYMAHELAVNSEVQKKLQQEIDGIIKKHGRRIPYEALLSMKYLDQVVSETLRKWPVGYEIDRLCTRDYLIQAKDPEEKCLLVKKGVAAVFPIMAIHRDPQYYPEPERFDPERFNDENKSKVRSDTYLPFGVGPRNCIGSRFALLELKILFCHLLAKFEIVPTAKTEIPIRISKKSYRLQPESGFWLGLKPRKESV